MLARFTQYEMMEERITNRLKSIAMGFYPVKIELKDFGSYPAHSIFINVVSREPVRDLVREIRESQRLLKPDNDHKPYFTDDPHMGIVIKTSTLAIRKRLAGICPPAFHGEIYCRKHAPAQTAARRKSLADCGASCISESAGCSETGRFIWMTVRMVGS